MNMAQFVPESKEVPKDYENMFKNNNKTTVTAKKRRKKQQKS